MSLLSETHSIQSKFGKYCRDGIEHELPGTTEGRLDQYRRLVYNIVNDNLESAYPIAYGFLEDEIREKLVFDFFSKHECQSYQIWKFPKEFYEFVVKENYSEQLNLPVLNDLLKFEWEEMEMYNMEDLAYPEFKPEGDIIKDVLAINPEFKLLALKYPVHLEKPDAAQQKEGNYFVLLYREQESGNIQFVDLSVWFAFMIEQIHQNKTSIANLILPGPEIFGNFDAKEIEESSIRFVKEMMEKGFVLGFV